MKIGIVTVYDSSNLGSYLQAYALKSYLESKEHEVYFVKQRSIVKEYIKTVYRSLKSSIKHGIGVLLFNICKCKKNYDDLKYFKTINIDDVNSKTLEMGILGSDEIWNVNKTYFRNASFWGGISIDSKRVVGYAISCGNATEEDIRKHSVLCNHMLSLYQVFARDTNTKCIIENISGKQIDEVCDPTILADTKIFFTQQNTDYKDYIVVYGYRFSKEQIEFIKKYAKDNRKKVVSICLYQNWCKNVNVSALEFASVLKNAYAVITNTFHGTVFSILTHAKFVTLAETNKVKDLLGKLNLKEKRCTVGDYAAFVEILEKDVDYDMVEAELLRIREESRNKIDAVIDALK